MRQWLVQPLPSFSLASLGVAVQTSLTRLFDTAFACAVRTVTWSFPGWFLWVPVTYLGSAKGKVEESPGVLVLKRSVLSSRRPGQDKNPSGMTFRGRTRAAQGSGLQAMGGLFQLEGFELRGSRQE